MSAGYYAGGGRNIGLLYSALFHPLSFNWVNSRKQVSCLDETDCCNSSKPLILRDYRAGFLIKTAKRVP